MENNKYSQRCEQIYQEPNLTDNTKLNLSRYKRQDNLVLCLDKNR